MNSSNSTPRLRHKVVDVTSIEHAAAVIRGMRSTFHSKTNYKRSACRDDQIINSIDEFDHLIVKTAFEVQEIKRVDNLITNITPKDIKERNFNSNTSQLKAIESNNDDFSSDEDDDNNVNINKNINDKNINMMKMEYSLPDTESTVYLEGGKAHHQSKLSQQSNSQLKSSSSSSSSKVINLTKSLKSNKYDDNSDDEEFLKKLVNDDDDDDDDMVELFKGFVGPKSTTTNQNSNNKNLKSFKASAMAEIDSDDDGDISINNHSPYHQRSVKSAGDNISNNNTMNSNNNNNTTTKSSVREKLRLTEKHSTQILFTSTRSQSASDARDIGNNYLNNNNNSNNSKITNSTLSSTINGSNQSNSTKTTSKHHIIVTPGQRIRVKPSRKQRNQQEF